MGAGGDTLTIFIFQLNYSTYTNTYSCTYIQYLDKGVFYYLHISEETAIYSGYVLQN